MPSDSLYASITTSNSGKNPSATVLVYLISGNPGLIGYYRDFFGHLATALASSPGNIRYDLSGRSLAGFELDTENHQLAEPPPYTLQEQVSNVHSRIDAAATDLRRDIEQQTGSRSPGRLPVILIGHSVGAHILLEIVARRQRAQRAGGVDSGYEIIGGINLFPTVVDIAKSPSGKIAVPFIVLPGFAWIIHWLARFLCFIIPSTILESIVRQVTGMPEGPAQTTKSFIQTRHGVYQALYMTKYELREIASDKWDDELWGVSSKPDSLQDNASGPVTIDTPKLYFYWGENDPWVDNRTRDGLIATRGRRLDEAGDETKPHMEIDTQGMPHAFCIRHSEPVAEKVARYIEEITSLRRKNKIHQ